jgi:hypothetical protein
MTRPQAKERGRSWASLTSVRSQKHPYGGPDPRIVRMFTVPIKEYLFGPIIDLIFIAILLGGVIALFS